MCRSARELDHMFLNRFVQFLLPLVVVGLLLLCGWLWPRYFTRHGKAMRVPDMKGMTFDKAQMASAGRELRAFCDDSVYTDEYPKGSVVVQGPLWPGRT